MQGRWLVPLLVLVVAACGNAFTAATGDGDGGGQGHDAAIDTGVPGDDGGDKTPKDASREDASDAMAMKDAPDLPPPLDGGMGSGDASSCSRTCPSGFACVLGKCEDRLLVNFSPSSNPSGNWSFGYFQYNGTSGFIAYPLRSTTNGLDFWSLSAASIEPSLFHNPSLMAQTLTGITPGTVQIPFGGLVLYPSPTLASVVRWTAPVAGTVDISATFTGLGTNPVTMSGAYVNIGLTGVFGQTINAFMGPNALTYSAAAQKVLVGDTIDFFAQFVTSGEDVEGATGLEVHFTLD
jgi:hypothetical protein